MATTPEFDAMLERALNGDVEAQTEIYLEFGSYMRRVIRLKLKRMRIAWAVEPDDVFDSAFAKIFLSGRSFGRFDNALHFLNYLEKAAQNRVLQILRNVMQEKASVSKTPVQDVAQGDAQLEEIVWREHLEAALATLTEREQRICQLFLQDLTWDEIGEVMDLSADAARKTHHRAETRIRSQLLARG